MNNARVIAIAAALVISSAGAEAFDEAKYPDLKGQWERIGVPNWTPAGKPPLTPEYEAVYEANRADMRNGGAGNVPSQYCFPQGMPMMMNLYDPMEIVITADVTYILISHVNDSYRRIYTDGRSWPNEDEYVPTYAGYSIGKWVDEDGDGRYDTLVVETRGFKGPRNYDVTGTPLHRDNQSIIRERIYLDKSDPNMLHDEITIIDHALTRPWTVTKNYRRAQSKQPIWWHEDICAEANVHVDIGGQAYFLSADGLLMPTKKDQPPPDLRYFKQTAR